MSTMLMHVSTTGMSVVTIAVVTIAVVAAVDVLIVFQCA